MVGAGVRKGGQNRLERRVTVTTRPPQAAGGVGFTSEPSGNAVWIERKQPSFIGIDGSMKQRMA